jgi:hypothetical protein
MSFNYTMDLEGGASPWDGKSILHTPSSKVVLD